MSFRILEGVHTGEESVEGEESGWEGPAEGRGLRRGGAY